MTNPISGRGRRAGRAFVEIVGDVSRFGPDVEKKINAALKDVGLKADFGPVREASGRAGAESGREFSVSFDREARAGVRSTGRAAANEVVVAMAGAAVAPTNRSRIFQAFARLGQTAARAASGVGATIGSSFMNAAEGIGGGISSAITRLGTTFISNLSMSMATTLIQMGLLIVVIPSLIGAITLLASTLVGLLGIVNALPGGFAVLLAAVLPLVVAFQGFGEALGAVMENDPEKLNKAMKNLTPSARAVVREFKSLMPFFTELRKIAQENLFAPLVGTLRDLFGVIGPEVRQGMASVAQSWGKLLAAVAGVGMSVPFKDLLRDLFGSTQTGEQAGAVSRILDRLTPSIERLMDAFVRAADASLPTVERIFASIASILDSIAATTTEAIADGSFQEWLDDALEIGGLLKDLLGALFEVLKTMFQETKDGGKEFLRDMIQAIKDLNEWLQSPEGQIALQELIRLANTFLETLKLVASILGSIMTFMGTVDYMIDKLLGKQQTLNSRGFGGVIATAVAGLKKLAVGGVVNQPTFAMVGEAGPEAVIPLNNPSRAAQVMQEAGLLDMRGMLDAGGTLVQVFLGTREITDILDTRVSRGLARTARSLSNGTRPAEGT